MSRTERSVSDLNLATDRVSISRFDLALVGISFLHVAFTILDFHFFGGEMTHDAGEVWKPFANQVLSGATPYVDVWDNKPPVWQYLSVGVAITGSYATVFYVLLGLANGVSAILVRKVCQQRGFARIGLLAAILYIAVIPLLNGMNINPRQFAAIPLIVAFLAPRALVSGAAVAIAGLLSQFSILVIPAVLLDRYYSGRLTTPWLVQFCGAGVALAVVAYLSVALFWGVDALVAALQTTISSSGEYVATRNVVLWENTLDWLQLMYVRLRTIIVLTVLASTGVVVTVSRQAPPRARSLGATCVLGCVGLAVPLTFRPGPIYLFAMLPFLAVLGAIGASSLLTAAVE